MNKTVKTEVLAEYPQLKERVIYRLNPVGKKGFGKLRAYLQIWDGDFPVCEDVSTTKAYLRARRILKRREKEKT